MRKIMVALTAALLLGLGLLASPASAAKPGSATTIQSGLIVDATGATVSVGFDDWGYNYQGHMFKGKYCDSYRDATWCQPYKDVNLSMKWNDAWIANTDANGDFLLDRRGGQSSYIGSGAWLTNHQSGVNDDGTKWTYFTKIIAAPADATSVGGIWYAADGSELGPVIWGEFFTAQEISNDPSAGLHGAQYISPSGPGFGQY